MDGAFRPRYYDRDGQPIPYETWAALMAREQEGETAAYWRVAVEKLFGYRVSTVWLGLDHGHGMTEKPIIFETMIFDDLGRDRRDEFDALSCVRYATIDEARAGHLVAVEAVRNHAERAFSKPPAT